MKFSELGITHNIIVGKKIEIEELFGRRILIEKTIITSSKFNDKNASGLRMQMQIVLATFVDDDYEKEPDGTPKGERRSCFTGSDVLISCIQAAEKLGKKDLYPIDTTIRKIGKCFQLT